MLCYQTICHRVLLLKQMINNALLILPLKRELTGLVSCQELLKLNHHIWLLFARLVTLESGSTWYMLT